MQTFCRFFLYRLLGWKIDGRIPHEIPRLLVVFLPHTSNWDFVIGMLFVFAERVNITLFGKDEFYVWPLTWAYRLFKVKPIARGQRANFVEQAARQYHADVKYWTAMAPEGTRGQVDHLKSGYYYFARQADVPLLTVGLDFQRKTLVIEPPRSLLDNFTEDAQCLIGFSRSIQAMKPEMGI